MTTAITTYEEQANELTLPGAAYISQELAAVKAFQLLVRQNLVEGSDYGVIPGTGTKPTLLKPGAEKMAKLLGLADHYEITDKVEDWDRPLFRYVVKCQLRSVRTGTVVSESYGECNSMESKYRWRWVFGSQVPAGINHAGLVSRSINTRNGPATQYRMDSDDVYSQINTLLKMAQKRALVGAALSAGRLSELFTADLEDMAPSESHPDATTAAPQRVGPQGATIASNLPKCPTHPDAGVKEWGGKFGKPKTWACKWNGGKDANGKWINCPWEVPQDAPVAASAMVVDQETGEVLTPTKAPTVAQECAAIAAAGGMGMDALRAWLVAEGLLDGRSVASHAPAALRAHLAAQAGPEVAAPMAGEPDYLEAITKLCESIPMEPDDYFAWLADTGLKDGTRETLTELENYRDRLREREQAQQGALV